MRGLRTGVRQDLPRATQALQCGSNAAARQFFDGGILSRHAGHIRMRGRQCGQGTLTGTRRALAQIGLRMRASLAGRSLARRWRRHGRRTRTINTRHGNS
jgi:hypothetical protein